MTFAVMFVCTGNICRSPMAQRLFAARVDPLLPIESFSSGTNGLVGWEMDAASARALHELGGDGDGHVARRLEPALIDRADLILGAEPQHVAIVVATDPKARSRSFAMREFAHFGAGIAPAGGAADSPAGAEGLRDRVRLVDAARSAAPPLPLGQASIGDPYGARMSQVRACARLVSAVVDDVVSVLGVGVHEVPA